jgi:hypothetical protein
VDIRANRARSYTRGGEGGICEPQNFRPAAEGDNSTTLMGENLPLPFPIAVGGVVPPPPPGYWQGKGLLKWEAWNDTQKKLKGPG